MGPFLCMEKTADELEWAQYVQWEKLLMSLIGPILLCSRGMFCLTWAGGLWPRHFAHWWWSFCFRYSVRALRLWQYGWYVVTRAWEISQAYEVFRGVCRFCATKLDWHKNSDWGSEVGIGTGLNSTTRRLIKSVVLLTKQIGIVTPLILSIVVVVALRYISYKRGYE